MASGFAEQIEITRRVLKVTGLISLFVLLFFYLSTCVSHVKIQETGVLLRFGKIVRPRVDPGICIKFPWPIDRLEHVKTRSVRTLQSGFGADPKQVMEFERLHGSIDQLEYGTLRIPYAITGDKNIVHLKVLVMYKVSEPEKYLFEINDLKTVLAYLTQNIILERVAVMHVDDLLTTGKLALRDNINHDLTALCSEMDLGITITSVEIRNARPPRKTTFAFKDVINAQEESRETVHQAEAYRNSLIPEAKAQAQTIIQEAEAYKNRKINHAKGEAERFTLLARKYRENPELTKERLRLETIEKILPNITKTVTTREAGKNLVNLRIFSGAK